MRQISSPASGLPHCEVSLTGDHNLWSPPTAPPSLPIDRLRSPVQVSQRSPPLSPRSELRPEPLRTRSPMLSPCREASASLTATAWMATSPPLSPIVATRTPSPNGARRTPSPIGAPRAHRAGTTFVGVPSTTSRPDIHSASVISTASSNVASPQVDSGSVGGTQEESLPQSGPSQSITGSAATRSVGSRFQLVPGSGSCIALSTTAAVAVSPKLQQQRRQPPAAVHRALSPVAATRALSPVATTRALSPVAATRAVSPVGTRHVCGSRSPCSLHRVLRHESAPTPPSTCRRCGMAICGDEPRAIQRVSSPRRAAPCSPKKVSVVTAACSGGSAMAGEVSLCQEAGSAAAEPRSNGRWLLVSGAEDEGSPIARERARFAPAVMVSAAANSAARALDGQQGKDVSEPRLGGKKGAGAKKLAAHSSKLKELQLQDKSPRYDGAGRLQVKQQASNLSPSQQLRKDTEGKWEQDNGRDEYVYSL
mmetsp:Transcript_11033/g.23218  ORF Transcript_11033/g.23218 Transcript_11033/m.23218 type:complete len:480 (+) Transcript_11033:67-1506(+)